MEFNSYLQFIYINSHAQLIYIPFNRQKKKDEKVIRVFRFREITFLI